MVDRKYSLKNRLLKYFSAFAIIPIILLSVALGAYLLANTVFSLKKNSEVQLSGLAEDFDLMLEDAYQIADIIAKNPFVIDALNENYISDKARYSAETKLNAKLAHLFAYYNNNIDYYIIGENGCKFTGVDKDFKDIDFLNSSWYRKARTQLASQWFSPHVGSFVATTNDNNYLSLVLPITSTYNDFYGTVVVDIRIEDISVYENQYYIINSDTLSVLEHGKWVNYSDKELITSLSKSKSTIKYWDPPDDKKEIFISETIQDITVHKFSGVNSWVYVSLQDKNDLYKTFLTILLISLCVIGAMAFLAYLLSYKVSNSLTTPLMELLDTMEDIRKGDFTARAKSDTNDEFAYLSESFNDMVINVNGLMKRIYEEQEKTKQYELMLLQAQINPHFLYNTLDSIIWLVRMKREEDSIKMVHALTAFLRSGLSKGKDIINLGQEIQNVSSYLTIQQLRYKNKLVYEIDFPDSILTQPIPKLTLQPLVENALYHGIKNMPEGGFIHIYGYTKDDDTYIVVSDNGVGMGKEKLEELRNEVDTEERLSSYGFRNVRDRLHLFFKSKCRVKIDSEENMGTTVTIIINGKVSNDV